MARRPTKKTAKIAEKKAKGKTKVPAKAAKTLKPKAKITNPTVGKGKAKAKPAKKVVAKAAQPAKAPKKVAAKSPAKAPGKTPKASLSAAAAKAPKTQAKIAPAKAPVKNAPNLKVVKNTAAQPKPAKAKPAKEPKTATVTDISSYTPKAMPRVGADAPAFNLPSSHGGSVALKSFRGAKNVVLYFYPKDDTPGCTVQACKFRDDLGGYQEQDAVVLGVSADDLKSHGKFTDKFNLTFPLLADTSTTTAQAYGVWVEKNMYGNKKLGIQRATFLIGKDGKIAHVWPKVSVEGHSDEVLEALRQLNDGHQDGADGEEADDAAAGQALDDDADDHVAADDDDDDDMPARGKGKGKGKKKGPHAEADSDDDDDERPAKRRAADDEEEDEYGGPTGPSGYGDDDD